MPLYKFPTNAIAGISGSSITTANVTEHTNLYFTNTRVHANVSPLLALKANVVDLSTSNVVEGANLYFTNTRVYANVVSGNFTQSNKAYAFTRIF